MKQAALVIGVGNEYRSDDAVGLLVARRLAEAAIPGVEVLEASGEGAALLDAWLGHDLVILVDAAAANAPAGSISRFAASDQPLPRDLLYYSSHLFGVAEAVEMARALDQLPARLLVYAVTGASFRHGTLLTPAVAAAVAAVVAQIYADLDSIHCARSNPGRK